MAAAGAGGGAAANGDREFVQIDVDGDGSCFYRAVYGAARHHPNGVLGNLYDCLEEGFTDYVGEVDKDKFIENEDTFVDTIREYLAALVEYTDFLTVFAKREDPKEVSIYEKYRKWAETKNPMFRIYMKEASKEFRDKFGSRPKFLALSEEKFKKEYATILRDRGSYAAEFEYQMLKFLLEGCGIQLDSVNLEDNDKPLTLTRAGQPLLLVCRLQTMEHYSYLMDETYYLAHMDMLVGSDDNVRPLSSWLISEKENVTSPVKPLKKNSMKKPSAKTAKKASAKKPSAKTLKKKPINAKLAAALANLKININNATPEMLANIKASLQ